MGSDIDIDEDEYCYRHPTVLTALHCAACDRPICTDCAVQAAVGFKCADCGRISRAARAAIPAGKLVPALVAAAALAAALGTVLAFVSVPFLGIILAYAVGLATGAVAKRVSGGYRDTLLARGSAIAAGLGILLPYIVIAAADGVFVRWLSSPGTLFEFAAAAFAAYGAYIRSQS